MSTWSVAMCFFICPKLADVKSQLRQEYTEFPFLTIFLWAFLWFLKRSTFDPAFPFFLAGSFTVNNFFLLNALFLRDVRPFLSSLFSIKTSCPVFFAEEVFLFSLPDSFSDVLFSFLFCPSRFLHFNFRFRFNRLPCWCGFALYIFWWRFARLRCFVLIQECFFSILTFD